MNLKLRLKDLDNIVSNNIDAVPIMKEVVGFKKTWFLNKWRFERASIKARALLSGARKIDLAKLEYNEDCKIKRPSHIDMIPTVAMFELTSKMRRDTVIGEEAKTISQIIAIASYDCNHEGEYDSESKEFKLFIEYIMNQPLEDMVGLHNWIVKSTNDSLKEWNRRFLSVKVDNPDYDKAEKGRMSQFKNINLIKALCRDFNCTYYEALQMPYVISQTSNYANATRAHIQDQERVIKETRMKAKRQAKHS